VEHVTLELGAMSSAPCWDYLKTKLKRDYLKNMIKCVKHKIDSKGVIVSGKRNTILVN